MRSRIRLYVAALSVAGLCALAASGQAAELYGTDFDVIYDPSTLGLFGSLSLTGNYLQFTPNNFIATSTNGQGVVTPSGGATTASGIQLIANPGFQFGALTLTEFGDYQLAGTGASVSLSGELIASDGDASGNPVLSYTTSTITAAGSLTVQTGLNGTQNWTAGAQIVNGTPTVFNGPAWLSSAGIVDISIENLLSASTTQPNSLALIQKKDALGGVGLTVSPVPLPPSVWLLSSAVAGLALAARRRRKPS